MGSNVSYNAHESPLRNWVAERIVVSTVRGAY